MKIAHRILTTLLSAAGILRADFQPDIVVDAHSDPTKVEFAGTWTDDLTVVAPFRGNGKVLNSTTANVNEYARFHTQLPVSGVWQVFVWSEGRSGFGDNVQIKVTHADSTPTTAISNQSTGSGQWLLAGTFWFDQSKEAEVKIVHNDAGKLYADAVRFSLFEAATEIDTAAPGVGVMTYSPSGAWTAVDESSGNRQTTRRSSTAASSATFAVSVPTPGEYRLTTWLPRKTGAWVPSGLVAPNTISFEVHHRNGQSEVAVPYEDTAANEGKWVPVGASFFFDPPPEGQANPFKVVIKCDGQPVPADAIRLTKLGSFEVVMDDDDPVGPPGVTLDPTATWTAQLGDNRPVQRFMNNNRVAFGPWAMRARSDLQATATYSAPLPELGLYDAYLYFPYTTTNTTNLHLSINGWALDPITGEPGVGLVERTINQQQTEANGAWMHVGRYILSPGNAANASERPVLTLISGFGSSQNYAFADAVLFLRDNEEVDADNDGLPDWHEIVLGTSASVDDINGDGVADGWDTDGDGMSDGDEYRLGRNPRLHAGDGTGVITLQVHTPTIR